MSKFLIGMYLIDMLCMNITKLHQVITHCIHGCMASLLFYTSCNMSLRFIPISPIAALHYICLCAAFSYILYIAAYVRKTSAFYPGPHFSR